MFDDEHKPTPSKFVEFTYYGEFTPPARRRGTASLDPNMRNRTYTHSDQKDTSRLREVPPHRLLCILRQLRQRGN
jgi:hypothetical protein